MIEIAVMLFFGFIAFFSIAHVGVMFERKRWEKLTNSVDFLTPGQVRNLQKEFAAVI